MQCNKLSLQLGAHTHALPASCAQHSRAAGADPLCCLVLCTLARFLGCLWCCLAPTTLGSLLLEPWCPPALARCCRYRRSAAAMAAADPPTITHCWSSTSTRAPARLFAAAARARCHHPIPAALCATHSWGQQPHTPLKHAAGGCPESDAAGRSPSKLLTTARQCRARPLSPPVVSRPYPLWLAWAPHSKAYSCTVGST
jgi:hypothetical protein